MKLIDFHAHLRSRTFFEALLARSPSTGNPDARLLRAASALGIQLPPVEIAAHGEHWIEELDRHGVDRVLMCADLPEEVSTVGEVAGQAEGRLVPIATIDPRSKGAADRVRHWIAEEGFRGVVLRPAMDHFDISAPECRPLLEVLAIHGGLAIVRCGLDSEPTADRLGIPKNVDLRFANPLSILPAANSFPGLRFVVPAFGAGFFRETLMLGTQCENVFLDTSSDHGWMKTQRRPQTLADVFERTLEVFGPERILFATGSREFPRGWRHERRTEQREALGACGLSREEMGLVFGGNAERILMDEPRGLTEFAPEPAERQAS